MARSGSLIDYERLHPPEDYDVRCCRGDIRDAQRYDKILICRIVVKKGIDPTALKTLVTP